MVTVVNSDLSFSRDRGAGCRCAPTPWRSTSQGLHCETARRDVVDALGRIQRVDEVVSAFADRDDRAADVVLELGQHLVLQNVSALRDKIATSSIHAPAGFARGPLDWEAYGGFWLFRCAEFGEL